MISDKQFRIRSTTQNSQERSARVGQPEQDLQYWQDRKARTEQPGRGRLEWTANCNKQLDRKLTNHLPDYIFVLGANFIFKMQISPVAQLKKLSKLTSLSGSYLYGYLSIETIPPPPHRQISLDSLFKASAVAGLCKSCDTWRTRGGKMN